MKAGRKLVVAAASAFGVSTAFPVVASLMAVEKPPRWVGLLDVTLAFAVVMMGLALVSRAGREYDPTVVGSAFRIYRASATAFLVLPSLFLLLGERIKWNVLLMGLAWRAWLFVYVLPAGLAVWRVKRNEQPVSRTDSGT